MPVSAQIRLARNYVAKLEKVVSGMELFARNPKAAAFDSMALQCISKAFALVRASLLLIEKGFPDEAYGLARSLVECAVGATVYHRQSCIAGSPDEGIHLLR